MSGYGRPQLISTALRALISAGVLLAVYYTVPIVHRPHEEVALRLAASLTLFGVILANEIRLISKHDRPMLRATVAMATVIPLFLVMFAWIYLSMSRSMPAAFGGPLDRSSALYFTITIFSTVGFGDITPKTDVARLVTCVQMLADLVLLAVVVRLIFATATRSEAKRRSADDDE